VGPLFVLGHPGQLPPEGTYKRDPDQYLTKRRARDDSVVAPQDRSGVGVQPRSSVNSPRSRTG